MSKKELDIEELGNVSGGFGNEGKSFVYCPNCHFVVPIQDAHIEGTGSNQKRYYTCPKCGTTFFKGL